jgi:glycoprotein-N-acetylgalactosamine 3-beta-galactosyltransferase
VWEELIVKNNEHYDWIIKADDDSYVSVENFKHLVRSKNFASSNPYYLGISIAIPGSLRFFNAGSGYALSKKALEIAAPHFPSSKFYNKTDPKRCKEDNTWSEDIKMAECLSHFGILPAKTRDEIHRENFLTYSVSFHLRTARRNDSKFALWEQKPENLGHGGNCCGIRPVTWHGYKVGSDLHRAFYYYDYLMYDLEVRNG